MWFSPLFSSKDKLEQASLKELWSSLSPQNVYSKVTVVLKINLIFASLNSPGKVSELTRVSSRGQATFFSSCSRREAHLPEIVVQNFKNWSCEGAVRITQSCLLHLPDAAARFLFSWALPCAEAHQAVCAQEDGTGGGSWVGLRCEFSHCQSTFRPCRASVYTVNQLHRSHVGRANRSLANELDVK